MRRPWRASGRAALCGFLAALALGGVLVAQALSPVPPVGLARVGAPVALPLPQPATSGSASGPTGFDAPGHLMAYVVDSAPTLTVVDLTLKVARTVPLPSTGFDLAVTPNGRQAYVVYASHSGFDGGHDSTVVPIDLATLRPGPQIPAGDGPNNVVLSPGGRTAYVADMGAMSFTDGQFHVVDSYTVTPIATATDRPGRPVTVGPGPGAAAISPDGRTLWVVAGTRSHPVGELVPVALPSMVVGRPVKVGISPMALAITPDGRDAVVADTGWVNDEGHDVTIVDLATRRVVRTVRVGPAPLYVAITPDSQWAFVANSGYGIDPAGDSVSAVNLATGQVRGPIVVGRGPTGLAITPAGHTVWVAAEGGGGGKPAATTIVPIDVATMAVGTPLPGGEAPGGIAIAAAPASTGRVRP